MLTVAMSLASRNFTSKFCSLFMLFCIFKSSAVAVYYFHTYIHNKIYYNPYISLFPLRHKTLEAALKNVLL